MSALETRIARSIRIAQKMNPFYRGSECSQSIRRDDKHEPSRPVEHRVPSLLQLVAKEMQQPSRDSEAPVFTSLRYNSPAELQLAESGLHRARITPRGCFTMA